MLIAYYTLKNKSVVFTTKIIMKLNIDLLHKCPLFAKIEKQEIEILLSCLGSKKIIFEKNDFIFNAGDILTKVGIVLSGSVHILQEDFWGRRNIFTRISPGYLLGAAFSCLEEVSPPVSAMSAENSEILFIDYAKIIKSCSSACSFHSILIKNIITILAQNNVKFIEKMEHLTKPNTREKLLSYLSRQAQRNKNSSFKIIFNRQELADYLSIDRSAMSKELSKMRRDGLIDFQKNSFTLITKSMIKGDSNA